jgi:hypothetical protein
MMMKSMEFVLIAARRVRALLALAAAALTIGACGGGAQTVENPVTSITPPQFYSGPPPANEDVAAFKLNVWDPIQQEATCANCHNQSESQTPMFARTDDVNLAYDAAITAVTLAVPSESLLVTKVRGSGGNTGHNCWLGDADACGDIMTTWIEGWAGATAQVGGRQIVLNPPPIADPGQSKSYANATAENFRDIVYTPYLEAFCAGCHNSSSSLSQQPYFAESGAVDSYLTAYEAAKPRMNLDDPAASQFVLRLSEGHNLVNWPGVTPAQAAAEMEQAIRDFAATVPTTALDPLLVNSKAMKLIDGTIASGGNRYESAQIGLWEFKTGSGTTAYDTSGVTPSLDLTLSGDYEWFGGWGITLNGGRAQGSTTDSRKLHDQIRATGEYSIEAWVVPGNVTQEMARIITYSAGDRARNFTLQQTLYNYDFLHRSTTTGGNGDAPQLSTPDADEVLQATLQHVVVTLSATEGRKIYVNGGLVSDPDPAGVGALSGWDDTFAFVLGSDAGGIGPWQGTLRMVAIHKFALTPAQIQQNYDVGVGEKFFLLFSIEDIINVPSAYILFEVSQFDSYAYLFNQPHFITLDDAQQPEGIPIEGMRIGVNGAEVDKSQTYANMNDVLSASLFGELGQLLSPLGAVMPLEKGPADDEFFLTFDRLGNETFVRTMDPPLVVTENDLPPAQRFGVRTFDEINATMAALTGVSPEDMAVDITFQNLRQSMPAVETPETFLSSHQVAVAQLAIEYCNALIENRGSTSTAEYFPGFNFDATPQDAFLNRDALIAPLIDNMMGIAIQTQPDFVVVQDELGYASAVAGGHPGDLIDRLIAGGTDTRSIAKGICAAVLGSAVTLVQ